MAARGSRNLAFGTHPFRTRRGGHGNLGERRVNPWGGGARQQPAPAACRRVGARPFRGFVVLSGGLQDLRSARISRPVRALVAWVGVALIALGFVTGQFDSYSVVVEFNERGEQLGRAVVEHVLLVGIALGIGALVGIALGLWAFREPRAAPLVLYTVSIIQTVPSLALFGALLVPLARLGDQRAGVVGVVFLALLAGATGLALLYWRFAQALPVGMRQAGLLLCAVTAAAPLVLVIVVASSLLFRGGALAFFTNAAPYSALRLVMGTALVLALTLGALRRVLKPGLGQRLSTYGIWAGYGSLGAALLAALGLAIRAVIGPIENPAALTVRDLGVSGIGPAPAVIALTLYALLPLVRNTYAGLRGVDPAVTDAGRGMGMTPAQRFVQLELPLALPVILAGARNAGVALVGTATIASLIGAGGLGDFVIGGIVNISVDQILLGTVPAVLLALLLDAALRGLGYALTPPGLRAAEAKGA